MDLNEKRREMKMCEIECSYKNKCTSHPHRCGSCSRNKGKRDYYRPRKWDWYTPYYPQWTTYPIWCGNTTAGDNYTDSNEYTTATCNISGDSHWHTPLGNHTHRIGMTVTNWTS